MLHRHQPFRVADPDCDRELGCVADEPRVTVVLGRSCLARDRPIVESSSLAGALGHYPLENRVDERGIVLVHRPLLDGIVRVGGAPVLDAEHRAGHIAEHGAVDPLAAVRKRREGAGHLQRADGLDAEADREVVLERPRDAELVRHVGHVLRAHLRGQLRVHRVVGVDGGVLEVDRPQVGALVVVHRPELVPEVDRGRLGGEHRLRGDPLLDRGRQHERLEGRPGLALTLHGQVELTLLEVLAAHHGEHATVARIDGDHCGVGPAWAGEPFVDRLACELLQLEVDRRVDLQPSAEDGARAVVRHELLLDVLGEVADPRRRSGETDVG